MMKTLLTITGALLFFAAYAQQPGQGNFRDARLAKHERQPMAQQFQIETKQASANSVSAEKSADVIVDMNTPQKVFTSGQPRPAVRSNVNVDYTKLQVPPYRPDARKGPRQVAQVDYSKPQEVKKRTN